MFTRGAKKWRRKSVCKRDVQMLNSAELNKKMRITRMHKKGSQRKLKQQTLIPLMIGFETILSWIISAYDVAISNSSSIIMYGLRQDKGCATRSCFCWCCHGQIYRSTTPSNSCTYLFRKKPLISYSETISTFLSPAMPSDCFLLENSY